MKNNKLLLIGGALIIVLAVGGLIVINNKSTTQTATPAVVEQSIPSIASKDIGLTLKQGIDSQRVVMGVSKTNGIQAIDYQLSWTSKGDIPRGAIGKLDFVEGKPASKELYLGTCSDVCHPDSDVSNIKLIVKVTKTDGKIYQAETSL